jgi:hypothetical protein
MNTLARLCFRQPSSLTSMLHGAYGHITYHGELGFCYKSVEEDGSNRQPQRESFSGTKLRKQVAFDFVSLLLLRGAVSVVLAKGGEY